LTVLKQLEFMLHKNPLVDMMLAAVHRQGRLEYRLFHTRLQRLATPTWLAFRLPPHLGSLPDVDKFIMACHQACNVDIRLLFSKVSFRVDEELNVIGLRHGSNPLQSFRRSLSLIQHCNKPMAFDRRHKLATPHPGTDGSYASPTA
jgi:hypothetical protein